MSNPLTTFENKYDQLLAGVVNGLDSQHSRRAYKRAIVDFGQWLQNSGQPGMSKATIQNYRADLEARGVGASSINLRMSALKKLAREAADNNWLDPLLAQGIANIKGIKQSGTRTGHWLTLKEAQVLLRAPNIETLKGLRDRAILAVFLGCGLRREEATNLNFSHIQQRDARWAIVDIQGKGNRVRTIPMPSWTKQAIDAWTTAAGISSDLVFRPIHKGGYITGETISAKALRDVVAGYAPGLAPHDLRRTYAKLAHQGGAALDQIQITLGHSSIATTERYLGVELDLTNSPGDHIKLRL